MNLHVTQIAVDDDTTHQSLDEPESIKDLLQLVQQVADELNHFEAQVNNFLRVEIQYHAPSECKEFIR